MSLPPIILRMPRLIYALAVLFFLWSFVLSYFELQTRMGNVDAENPMVRLAMLRGLFQAALEATYIALNGVIVHVLLAIWESGRASLAAGDGE